MFSNPLSQPTKSAIINKKLRRINRSTDVKDLRSLTHFDKILSDNPHREKIQGYYVEIPLCEYQTYVPNGVNFPDRSGNHYEDGAFNVALLTLEEWRNNWEKYNPTSSKPDLLVNANWFNVWKSGIPNQGEKINPRTQDRTFLTGLSLNNGELISSHTALDQNEVGLDTIIFDTKSHQAAILPHSEIDSTLEKQSNFYNNKNAVSGFIILNNGIKQKTPDSNNNHSNRLPRSGVGYKNDGKNVVVMVIHNRNRLCGVTAEEFANLFAALGCDNALNLDNSGSVELYYNGLSEFGKKTVTVNTETCDAEVSQRPKPNFLGFKNVSKCKLFANDDFDIPKKNLSNANVQTSLSKPPKTDDDITYNYRSKR